MEKKGTSCNVKNRVRDNILFFSLSRRRNAVISPYHNLVGKIHINEELRDAQNCAGKNLLEEPHRQNLLYQNQTIKSFLHNDPMLSKGKMKVNNVRLIYQEQNKHTELVTAECSFIIDPVTRF